MDKQMGGNDHAAPTSADTRTIPLKEFNMGISTNGVPQDLQLVKDMEPFVSPLTEANLLYHTSSHPSSDDARCRYVEAFVTSQSRMLQMEAELQRRTQAEISSLVPLDTLSVHEEVVSERIMDDQSQHQPTNTSITRSSSITGHNDRASPNVKNRKRPIWLQLLFKRRNTNAPSTPLPPEPSNSSSSQNHEFPNSSATNSAYQQYHEQTMTMLHEDIHNFTSGNFRTAQRDSGISISSASRGTQSKRARLSLHFAPHLRTVREEGHQPSQTGDLLAFRYPRMIHKRTLRDAALCLLSSTDDQVNEQFNKRFSAPGIYCPFQLA
ncbi:hypothetical protein K492DRAFT_194348 [Lichtheimia hyalospora FSU 10163]|nr:hypothetical protein K492DRAFT_194348 [Lichtheimia hyalospora FSU 10163]